MFGTITALEGMIPFKATTTSSPTRSQIENMMERHSSVLEVLLRARGVPVPQTATPAYSFLERVVLLRTAADILYRLSMEKGEQDSRIAGLYAQQADQMVQQVEANPQSLIETD